MPFQILSGGNRITLMGQIEAPEEGAGTIWPFKIGGGGTVFLTSLNGQGEPLILNHIAVSGRYDADRRRFVVDEGDLGNTDVGLAMSGNVDFSGADLRLAAGLAGHAHAGRHAETGMAGFRRTESADVDQRASHER